MDNERAFLHSLATPLATAHFLVDSIKEDLADHPDPSSSILPQLEKASKALNQAVSLIRDRRESLIKAGVPNGSSG